jgi:CIC family chloride channel protein
VEPRVLGVGYGTIHSLLRGELLGSVVLGLMVVKALVWAIALGSGTSGGVLAPLLIIGGSLGTPAGSWIPVGDHGRWALRRHGGHDGRHDAVAVGRHSLRGRTDP